jgi:hypothetical protein
MADLSSMTVSEAAGKMLTGEHADVVREAVRLVLAELMEAEIGEFAGAARYERSAERLAQRNGYRQRQWDTRVGSLELAIPRLRSGSYFPSFLEPRRRSEQALVAVVAEAFRERRQYAQGGAPRRPARHREHEPLHGEPPLQDPRRAGTDLPRAPEGFANTRHVRQSTFVE